MTRTNPIAGLFGVAFGFGFSGAGLNQYDVIHQMLLLKNFDPFLIMASAMATALPILWLLERRQWTTPLGGPLHLNRWPIERKHVIGGVIFGAGWAVTGACPGTASTTLGSGSGMGIVLIAGMMLGTRLRDFHVQQTTESRSTTSGLIEPAHS
jgi:uncharacterized protein